MDAGPRATPDEDLLPRLMASIAAFVVFLVASGLAQRYVATLHVSPATASGQAALIFRAGMPVVIDLSVMIYLSIIKVYNCGRLPLSSFVEGSLKATQNRPIGYVAL